MKKNNWQFKNLFQGRLSRVNFLIGNLTINLIFLIFIYYYFTRFRYDLFQWLWALSFLVILTSLSLIIRRLHDVGMSGWWVLLIFIPVINIIFLLVLYIYPSESERNEYGSSDKGLIFPIIGIEKSDS